MQSEISRLIYSRATDHGRSPDLNVVRTTSHATLALYTDVQIADKLRIAGAIKL